MNNIHKHYLIRKTEAILKIYSFAPAITSQCNTLILQLNGGQGYLISISERMRTINRMIKEIK